jgi:hypothetical protein
MNKSSKNFKLFSIRPEDSVPIQLEWQWVQKYLGISYLLFKTFGALLALIIVLADRDETSAALIRNVGLSVIAWLLLNYGFNFLLRYLTERSLYTAVETASAPESPKQPEPVRLGHYLAFKQRLYEQHKEDAWWESGPDDFFEDAGSVPLPPAVRQKVITWSEAQRLSLPEAVEELLISGLVSVELDKIGRDAGWKAEPVMGGGIWN